VKERGLRILVHGPPQYGKSLPVSKRFPAYALGVKPLLRIVLAGYNVTHAKGFCEVVRDVMNGPEFKEMFSSLESAVPKNASAEMFSTTARAALQDGQESITAVGLLSGFTGRGADLLIIDDPYASPDDARSEAVNERVWRWWSELAKVRISDDTNVLVMFHRYHEDDFAGRLMAEGGWEYYRFPAIADENEDKDDPTGRAVGKLLSPMRSSAFLHAIEDRDPQVWLSQFQGRPRPPEGAFIRREWLKSVPASAVPPLDQWVRFWDLATTAEQKGDCTSGALVGVGPDQTLYVRDVTRFRAEWPDACQIIADTAASDELFCREAGAKYWVGLEKVAWMRPMTQDLFAQPLFRRIQLLELTPKGDKKERASGWVARAKYDRVRLVLGPWNDAFIKEALAFDGLGLVHDDQVDSVSGGYQLVWDLKGGLVAEETGPAVGSLEYYRELAKDARSGEDALDAWGDDEGRG
jgi:hypothetical protein